MFNILVVEDDKELRELFCIVLNNHGYTTIPAVDGKDALDILDNNYVDLIISDIMMPNIDGYELTRMIRETHDLTPILMITAKETSADKHKGFLSGTDDYMVKPIDVNEMVWRVEALLRRARIASERKIKFNQTEMDCDSLTVGYKGEQIILPQKEFFLLYKLASSPNRIFTRRQLMDEIWGIDSGTDTHTLDVHISRLRDRFKKNADFEIITVRGLGYKVVINGD